MVPRINLKALAIKETPGSRQRTLDAIAKWRQADEDIKRICKEKGLTVPVMTC
jgi:hypothetical protein